MMALFRPPLGLAASLPRAAVLAAADGRAAPLVAGFPPVADLDRHVRQPERALAERPGQLIPVAHRDTPDRRRTGQGHHGVRGDLCLVPPSPLRAVGPTILAVARSPHLTPVKPRRGGFAERSAPHGR